ncbi:uncharacterized protein LOC132266263 [Cornus florida]|uniref:uncharacterized protein LOC132266263 n=1 Tax=Cornus florida TaxID=4283 RepID=UPI0028990FB8|nr:uncharacterized protein LOC132266263 [Cornus florida]XP_059623109.1 uncharacterized protein LOC132266263 [Cornus florida]
MAFSDSDSDSDSDLISSVLVERPPHRPEESLGPNQYLAYTSLPISLICDSCGNRMPKCSEIAVTHDVSGKGGRDITWSKIYVDCTNSNCIAEITLKRKGCQFVVLSGATPYFRPEDEKLECPGKVGIKTHRIYQGNLASSGVMASIASSVMAPSKINSKQKRRKRKIIPAK